MPCSLCLLLKMKKELLVSVQHAVPIREGIRIKLSAFMEEFRSSHGLAIGHVWVVLFLWVKKGLSMLLARLHANMIASFTSIIVYVIWVGLYM